MALRSIYHHKQLHYGVRISILLCLVAVIIWGVTLESNVTIYNHEPFYTVNTHWSQRIGQQALPLADIQDALPPSPQAPIVIERIISDMAQDRSLLFYASHQEVFIYINDILQYTLTCPDEMGFYQSPGRSWVEFPIRSDMIGQTLRIEFHTPFPFYNTIPPDFYYVTANDIQLVQIDYMWVRNTVALCIIALAIITYVNASIWKFPKLRRYLFSLADVYLFSGLWLCGEINVLAIWTGNSTLSSFLSMIFIRIIPITYYQFTCATAPYKSRWLQGLGCLAWGNLLLSITLQFFGISLVTTLPWTVGVFAISSLVYLIGFFIQNRNLQYTYKQAHYASLVLPIAVMVEVYCYIHQGVTQQLTGLFVAIACLVYSIIAHVLLVQDESKTQVEKRELERHQRALEKKPLFQQINAHFLFNTLNTISAYCKEAPEIADRAVTLLAQYMRGLMNLTNAEDYVPFEKELSLIQWYLEILNLRYEEKIGLELDIDFDDFLLPPLTLQPLVENAVLHGLHHYVSDGQIRIYVRRHSSIVEVVVSDNGQGFDPTTPSKGVGLQNITQRIRAMGGTIWTESHIGSGTDVILRVPLQPDEYSEKEALL